MKLFASIYLLYLLLASSASATPIVLERSQLHTQPSSPKSPSLNLKPSKQSFYIAIQINASLHTFSLAELLVYQFLSLALAASLFYLIIN